jgi:xanthine dehydrogenase accessory factor
MKEIIEIIQAFDRAKEENKKTALATVVHVEGSSYRRPGARMLITEEGEMTGAISGGCLEGDALRKALLTIMEQQAKLVTYDTNDEDDAQLGLGLGCNGIIQVLIEPIDPANLDNPVQLLKRVTAKRQKASLVTLFSLQDKRKTQPGTCMLVTEEGMVQGTTPVLHDVLQAEAKEVFDIKTISI